MQGIWSCGEVLNYWQDGKEGMRNIARKLEGDRLKCRDRGRKGLRQEEEI